MKARALSLQPDRDFRTGQDVWAGCACAADAGLWTLASVSILPAGLGAQTCVSLVSELPVSLPATCGLWEMAACFFLMELNFPPLCSLYKNAGAHQTHPTSIRESERLGSKPHSATTTRPPLTSAPPWTSVSPCAMWGVSWPAGLPPSRCSLELWTPRRVHVSTQSPLLSLKAAEIKQPNSHQGDGSSARGAAGTNWAVVLHYFRQVGPHHHTSVPPANGTVRGRQHSGGRGPVPPPGPLTPPSKTTGEGGGSTREDF